jgi:hypothetical protein
MRYSRLFLKAFWLLCVLFSFFQLSRPFRETLGEDQPMDMRQIWVSAQLLAEGQNPYSDSLLKAKWRASAEKEELLSTKIPGAPQNYSVYPMHFLVLMKPFSILSWKSFRVLWWALLFLLTIGLFALEWHNFGWRIIPSFLAFKSFVVAFIIGQPVLIVLFAIAALLHVEEHKKSTTLSTILLLMISLKVSLLIPLGLWMLIRRRYQPIAITAGILGITYVAFLLRVPDFKLVMNTWLQNMSLQWLSAYSATNELQFLLTESGMWIKQFIRISSLQPILRYSLLLAGTMGLMMEYRSRRIGSYTLLFGLMLLGFMLSYHLIYDLVLLIPLLWRIAKALPWWSAILALPAILPINGLSNNLWLQLHIPILLLFIAVIYVFLFVLKPRHFGSGENIVY